MFVARGMRLLESSNSARSVRKSCFAGRKDSVEYEKKDGTMLERFLGLDHDDEISSAHHNMEELRLLLR